MIGKLIEANKLNVSWAQALGVFRVWYHTAGEDYFETRSADLGTAVRECVAKLEVNQKE